MFVVMQDRDSAGGHKEYSIDISEKKLDFEISDYYGKNQWQIGIRFPRATKDVTLTIKDLFAINNTNTEITKESMYGEEGYVLTIQENPLIKVADAESLSSFIGKKVVGMRFRPLKVSALSDPSIEAGDPAYISDRLGNSYQTFLTNIAFSVGGYESFSCGAETAGENQSTSYSEGAKMTVDTTMNIDKKLKKYDVGLQKQLDLVLFLFGLYRTNGENCYYIHDEEELTASMKIWQINKDGIFLVSTDGGATWSNGFDDNGQPALPVIGGQDGNTE